MGKDLNGWKKLCSIWKENSTSDIWPQEGLEHGIIWSKN